MEILYSVGSFALSLFITVLSVKLAAGWLRAENDSWGRCLVALLLAYVVFAVIGIGASIAAGMLPEPINLVALVVALIAAIVAPVIVFARVLDTSWLRGLAIVVIALVVNIAIMFGIVFAIMTVLGIGMAGLGAMLGMGGMGGMAPGAADGAALDLLERDVTQLCACSDQGCVDRVSNDMLDNLMAAMEASTTSGDPADQARLEALSQRMDQCQNAGVAQPAPMPEPEPAPMPAPEPAPMPAPAPATEPMSTGSAGSYAYRDVPLASAAEQIGKLVRVTFADGTRLRDQLVALEGGSFVLKRGKSEGGGRYTVAEGDVVRMEVFDR